MIIKLQSYMDELTKAAIYNHMLRQGNFQCSRNTVSEYIFSISRNSWCEIINIFEGRRELKFIKLQQYYL